MNLPPDPRFYRRFWSYVDQGDPSTCWPWRAAVDRQGYGWFTWPGHGHRRQKYRAHRVALALVESPNSDDLLCLHACDVPGCCNPNHLRWGTAADNVRDRDRPARRGLLRIERLARMGLQQLPLGLSTGEPTMPTHPDFATLDRHVLRVAHGSLLDNPLDADPGSQVWIATIWPDRQQPGGWGRLIWDRHPSGRGWTIHPLTHLGDVIEFGADRSATPDRWYGYVADADETSIDLVGPFTTAEETQTDGSMSLMRWRTPDYPNCRVAR